LPGDQFFIFIILFKVVYFKHRRQRAEATYMLVKQYNKHMHDEQ